MEIIELITFLEKFDIEETKITNFVKNKIIIEKNENLFLRQNKFKNNQIFDDNLIFIQLKNLLPSKYLLNFIFNNTKNKAELKSEKQAMNFTYSKNLAFESIASDIRFIKGKYYLIIFKNKLLGYVEKEKGDKKHPLQNLFDIGEYLKEN